MKKWFIVVLLCCFSQVYAQKMSGNYLAKYSMAVKSVAWRADGKYFAACGDNFVVLWYAETNTIATMYSGEGSASDNKATSETNSVVTYDEEKPVFRRVSFSDNGKWLLGVRSDDTVFVWNMEDDFKIDVIKQDDLFIDDAAFLGNGYRIVMLGQGRVFSEYFKLVQTNEILIDKRVEFPVKVNSLDVSSDKKKVLTVCEDGVIALIDTSDWNVSMPFDWEVSKDMRVRFSPSGEYFLGKVAQSTLRIAAVDGGKKSINITDEDGFTNAAVFSSDNKHIAAGMKNSLVRIYSLGAINIVNKELKLAKGDIATAIEYSPDGEYLIVGTEKGYVLRMRKDGKLYSHKDKKYKESDLVGLSEGLREGKGGGGEREEIKVGDSVDISVFYSTLPESYYIGSFGLESEYKNRSLVPSLISDYLPNAFWGVDVAFSIGLPSYNFPYYYKTGNVVLSPPYIYTASIYLCAGYQYLFGQSGFSLFTELKSGASFRILCNNSIEYLHTGKMYPSVSEELLVGLGYKMLVLVGGANFDSNLGILYKCAVGLSIGL